jgi:hypothetical protein
MEGHGAYDRHSLAQHSAGGLGLPLLERAAGEAALGPGGGPVVIADLGAAGARNELEPMATAIAGLRSRGVAGPIVVVHTDIPANDFTTLFETIEGDPRTYLRLPDVYAFAAGRSFYERIFPPSSITLGWSAIAVHWLSRVPVPIRDHVYCSFATGDARQALMRRSADDWNAFCDARAVEMRPGAQLVVVGGAGEESWESVRDLVLDWDGIFSRFRPGSELNRVNTSGEEVVLVSETFAQVVRVALSAARTTRGLVDPTLGAALENFVGLFGLHQQSTHMAIAEAGNGVEALEAYDLPDLVRPLLHQLVASGELPLSYATDDVVVTVGAFSAMGRFGNGPAQHRSVCLRQVSRHAEVCGPLRDARPERLGRLAEGRDGPRTAGVRVFQQYDQRAGAGRRRQAPIGARDSLDASIE